MRTTYHAKRVCLGERHYQLSTTMEEREPWQFHYGWPLIRRQVSWSDSESQESFERWIKYRVTAARGEIVCFCLNIRDLIDHSSQYRVSNRQEEFACFCRDCQEFIEYALNIAWSNLRDDAFVSGDVSGNLSSVQSNIDVPTSLKDFPFPLQLPAIRSFLHHHHPTMWMSG
jgi:hypothetical protein